MLLKPADRRQELNAILKRGLLHGIALLNKEGKSNDNVTNASGEDADDELLRNRPGGCANAQLGPALLAWHGGRIPSRQIHGVIHLYRCLMWHLCFETHPLLLAACRGGSAN